MQTKTSNTRKPIKQPVMTTKQRAKPNAPKAKRTKASMILTLLKRSKGASLVEISTATGWQPHSVRGFLSGTIKKRMGLELSSKPDGKGQRRYYLVSETDNKS